MNIHKVATFVLLAFVGVSIAVLLIRETASTSLRAESAERALSAETPGVFESGTVAETAAFPRRIVLYYFHGNYRCSTCLAIEAYAKEAIEAAFPELLREGLLVWRPVNIDEPEHRHFVQDYQLATRSLIIAEFRGEEQIRWKNLEEIWVHVHEKPKFLEYVQKETRGYLESAS